MQLVAELRDALRGHPASFRKAMQSRLKSAAFSTMTQWPHPVSNVTRASLHDCAIASAPDHGQNWSFMPHSANTGQEMLASSGARCGTCSVVSTRLGCVA